VYSLDTANDARILVVEDALKRLENIFSKRLLRFQVDYKRLLELHGKAKEAYYGIKFSYQEPEEIKSSKSLESLVESIEKFEDIYQTARNERAFKPENPSQKKLIAETEYVFRTVFGFGNRLNYPSDPAFAIDILCVEITHASHIEESDSLTACRCSDGSRIWEILTNIDFLDTELKMPAGVLPPTELMNSVSEAMFLHRSPLSQDTPLGRLDDPPNEALDQARAQVLNIAKKVK
jgi:predicted RNA-binding protein with EMAP domain